MTDRFHRGTRGFAAFLTALNGFVVLGATLFVVPTLPIDSLVATTLATLAVQTSLNTGAPVRLELPVRTPASNGSRA